MTFSYLNHAKGLNGNPTGATNMTGVDLIVIYQNSYNGTPASSVSDNLGNTYTGLTKHTNASGAVAQLFYKQAPTVSSTQTFQSANVNADICVEGFSGSAASPFDVENGSTSGSSPITTGSITPSQNNELVVVGAGGDTFAAYTISGYTQTDTNDHTSAWGMVMAYAIQTTATATNPSISYASGTYSASSIASFKASSGAARGLFLPPRLTGLGAGGSFFNDRLAA